MVGMIEVALIDEERRGIGPDGDIGPQPADLADDVEAEAMAPLETTQMVTSAPSAAILAIVPPAPNSASSGWATTTRALPTSVPLRFMLS
jgi:hypothetical protein